MGRKKREVEEVKPTTSKAINNTITPTVKQKKTRSRKAKNPPKTECITIKVLDSWVNADERLSSHWNKYYHYPIDAILGATISEVSI